MASSYEFLWLSADAHKLTLPSLRSHKLFTAGIISIILFSLYYLNFVVRRPKIFGGDGPWRAHLLRYCPSLRRLYWPTAWACGAHLNTVLRAVLQRDVAMQYEREILVLSDGGELALDWALQSSAAPSDQTRPVLLIIPGISGSSVEKYIKHFVSDGLVEGYRPVVMNQRGTGGVRLKTYRTYCASDISDLAEVMFHIQTRRYPQAAVVGVGLSLGGMILTQYLHKLGEDCDMKAVLAVSSTFNPFRTQQSLEERMDNRILYSRFLTRKLKEIVRRNTADVPAEALEGLPYDVEQVLQCQLVSEMDTLLTVPVFGYSSLADYYSASRNAGKLHMVSRPFMCVCAEDDPFVPCDSLPSVEFQCNPHTVLVQTARGGHLGFLEGVVPTGGSWMNRVCREFLRAVKTYDN